MPAFPFSSALDVRLPPQPCLREFLEPDRDRSCKYGKLSARKHNRRTHRSLQLLSDGDIFDSIFLHGKLAFGGEPDGLLMSPAASALFLGLSSEIQSPS